MQAGATMEEQQPAQSHVPQSHVLQVQAAPPDPEAQADMLELSMLFFVAALVIFCARRLLDLFRVDHD